MGEELVSFRLRSMTGNKAPLNDRIRWLSLPAKARRAGGAEAAEAIQLKNSLYLNKTLLP